MTISLEQLMQILSSTAGDEIGAPAGTELIDASFDAMGCDSLALLEASIRLEREFGVIVPGEALPDLTTPREMLAYINRPAAAAPEPPARPGGSPFFRVLLRLDVKPGLEEEFERVWLSVAGTVSAQPSNIGQWLMRADEDAPVYHIVSDWTDEAAFRAFEGSDVHVTHRQRLHPYRLAGTMSTMRAVHQLAGAAATVERS